MYDLSIIIVNKDAGECLEKCVDSIFIHTGESGLQFEIFVVDNASTDNSLKKIDKPLYKDKIQIIRNKENKGFARANNQALKISSGRYILLLNPDAVVRKNCIYESIAFLNSNPDAGAVGCRLLNEDGTWQRSYGNFPTLIKEAAEAVFPRVLLRKGIFHAVHGYREYPQVTEVDWISGAFFLMRKDILKSVGLLDESFFMYFEDIDLCKRIKDADWKIYFYPPAEAIHTMNRTLSPTKSTLIDNTDSPFIYFKKHHGTAAAICLWFLIIIKTSLRVLFFSFLSVFFLNKNVTRKAKLNWNTLIRLFDKNLLWPL